MYWGARDHKALNHYQAIINSAMENNRLDRFIPVYSREDKKHYVQNQLRENIPQIVELFKNGGVIMICGSIFMQQEVLALLTEICEDNALKSLSAYQNKGQLLMDCY